MASLENFRLVVFRAVAADLNFRKAAEALYLTQPAVSLQIKALEDDLGVQLFRRAGSRITFTDAGLVLLDYANRAHALLSEAELALASLTGETAGSLALGASTTIAQYVLPELLGSFTRDNPGISATLISGNTEQIVAAVVAGKITLGLIEGPARSREVKTEPFLKDELALIVPAAHPWAARASAGAEEITALPLLMRERGSGTRQIVELALEKHHIKPGSLNLAMELDSTEAIKSAVAAGLGAGFVSRCALAKDSRLGKVFKIVTVDGLRIERDFLIVHAAGPEPQGLPQKFRKFLFSQL
jgi:DNA-binding transcriptional LysR family regulator